MKNMVDTIYTIEEAAAVLKIKPRTVRSWIDSGKIKSFHIGDLVRIHEDDLKDFIAQARRSG
jgi:excisionase family DNA binding protein